MTTTGPRRRLRRATTATAVCVAGVVVPASGADVGARPSVNFQQADEIDPDALAALPPIDTRAVGDVGGEHPSVSGDGRFVVFQGAPTDEADTRLSTIYLTDRETTETIELSPVPDGIRVGDTRFPVISSDGCSVAAVSEMALDVFRDDDNAERWDVYRSTLPHCGGAIGAWDLVSNRADGGGLARDDVTVAPPTMAVGGTLIAYTHPADHLFEADGITTISLVDLTVPVDSPGRSRFVAGSPADTANDTFIHRGLDQPVLSGDGENLAYRSDATSNLAVPGWAPGQVDGGLATPQVFAWDIDEPDPFAAVKLISARPDGTPALNGAGEPDISRDGTAVSFSSTSTDLVDATYPDCSNGCPSQVFVAKRDSNADGVVNASDTIELQLLSVENGVEPLVAGTSSSNQPAISGDGQLVAFVTKAANLQLIEVPALGGGDDGDLLLAEVGKARLSRATNRLGQVVPTQGVHAHPDLSDSGRTTVFDTVAANDLLIEGALVGRQVVARSSDPLLSLPETDIGTTLVNVASDEWYLAVINDGPSSFRPTVVTVSDPRFAIDEEDSSCLFESAIPAGGSCTIEVTYTPTSPGSNSAVVTVAEEGFGAVSVSSTVRGAGGNPTLRVRSVPEDIGVVRVGEPSVEYQFDLNNVGFVPVDLRAPEISGEHASDFEITTNNCVFRPINPRAACSIGVTFTPSDEGRRTALVEISTTDGQYTTALLSGDGEYAPVVEVVDTSVEAGSDFLATGDQYPPNTEVTVVFGDGPSSFVTTTTDDTGSFEVMVPVDLGERGGDRRIVVQSTSGAAASAPVEVVEIDDQAMVGLPGFGLG